MSYSFLSRCSSIRSSVLNISSVAEQILIMFKSTVGEDDCDTGPASRESSPRLESPAPGVTPTTIMTRKIIPIHFNYLLGLF